MIVNIIFKDRNLSVNKNPLIYLNPESKLDSDLVKEYEDFLASAEFRGVSEDSDELLSNASDVFQNTDETEYSKIPTINNINVILLKKKQFLS